MSNSVNPEGKQQQEEDSSFRLKAMSEFSSMTQDEAGKAKISIRMEAIDTHISSEASPHPASAPVRILVLLDASGSMSNVSGPVKASLGFVAQALADRGDPKSKLGVMYFNHDVIPIQELANLPREKALLDELVLNCASQFVAQGSTDLCKGIKGALDAIRADGTCLVPDGGGVSYQDVIILVSDGRANVGELDSAKIVKECQDCPAYMNTTIYALALGDTCDIESLNRIAGESTSGCVFEAPKKNSDPSGPIGALLGLALYQVYMNCQVIVKSSGDGPAPWDASLLPHQRNEYTHSLVYPVGHIALGQSCDICLHVDVRSGEPVEVRAIYSHIFAPRGNCTEVCKKIVFEDVNMEKLPEEPTNLQVSLLFHRIKAAKILATIPKNLLERAAWTDSLKAAGESIGLLQASLKAPISVEETSICETLDTLRTRIFWMLEAHENNDELQMLQLERCVTAEYLGQRPTTYEGVTARRLEANGGLSGFDDLPSQLSMPMLMRTMSTQASQHSESHQMGEVGEGLIFSQIQEELPPMNLPPLSRSYTNDPRIVRYSPHRPTSIICNRSPKKRRRRDENP